MIRQLLPGAEKDVQCRMYQLDQIITELLQNSLDANSIQISVGLTLTKDQFQVKVDDDGDGMGVCDMDKLGSLGVSSKHEDDGKYGFHGKAVASLIGLSEHVSIITRAKGMFSTRCRHWKNGQDVMKMGCRHSMKQVGTCVVLDGLFDRWPVRRKSIDLDTSVAAIERSLLLHSLLNPHAKITFTANGILTRNFDAGAQNLEARLMSELFPRRQVKYSEITESGLTVKIIQTVDQGTKRHVFVNKRELVQSSDIYKIVVEALGKCSFWVSIDCPRSMIQMNIKSLVCDITLLKPELLIRLLHPLPDVTAESSEPAIAAGKVKLHELLSRKISSSKDSVLRKSAMVNQGTDWVNSLFKQFKNPTFKKQDAVKSKASLMFSEQLTRDDLDEFVLLGQLKQQFLICSLPLRHLIVAIDQHAADERFRLESLVASLMHLLPNGQYHLNPDKFELASPRIIPERVPTSHLHYLKQWGFVCSYVNDGKVKLVSAPAVLKTRFDRDETCFDNLFEDQQRKVSSVLFKTPMSAWACMPKHMTYLLSSIACRSAIMFNTKLSVSDCQSLIAQLQECEFPFHCAHGRPSMVPLCRVD
jgi:DNA mismatch repair ATPase MutL